MPVPGEAITIRFGISLAGHGRIELRGAELSPAPPETRGVKPSMDIPDGDLVRLARDGDPAAFRLLVERHLPMARARAARLCPQPDDADDAVQDAFLQAFIALDRLRDPDRFAGWLGGIVANVCRAQRRRAPLTLLGDWPENLHPASAAACRRPRTWTAPTCSAARSPACPPGSATPSPLFYYADQPAGQVAATPGAAKASLHKARRRLREYITAHRPDLIPALSRRIPMTAVRIAHADPGPDDTSREDIRRARGPRRRRWPPGAAGPAPWPRSSGSCSAALTTVMRNPWTVIPRR